MDKVELIKSETDNLLKKIIDKYEVEVTEDDAVYHVMIKTKEEAPVVIGRHGETIKAIQKILEVVLYKQLGESVEVLVNVNDYREKQKERLEQLAEKFVQKTKDTKSASYLRGLSSYERKLVHEYIVDNYPELTSYSEGEGKDRRLVLDLKENAPEAEDENKAE